MADKKESSSRASLSVSGGGVGYSRRDKPSALVRRLPGLYLMVNEYPCQCNAQHCKRLLPALREFKNVKDT